MENEAILLRLIEARPIVISAEEREARKDELQHH
jgi:hypothetical protein